MTIFEILDCFAASEPPLLTLLELFHGVNARHQSEIKQRVSLSAIDYVEGEGFVLWWVDDSEVKPLCVSFCVEIVLQKQVVFPLIYLVHTMEVS